VTIEIPVDRTSAGGASEGGLQLGIPADAPNVSLAYDLLLTLTSAPIQEIAFADGSGPLPATRAAHDGSLAQTTDGFFVDSSPDGVYSSTALARPDALATPERRVVIEAAIEAVNGVENGGQTPEAGWTSLLDGLVERLK